MRLAPLPLAAALLAASHATTHAADVTRLVAATVHPDGAVVERELKVPGGTRHVEIACLPASLDLSTVQVDGAPDLAVGDLRSEPVLATEASACQRDPLAEKLRGLQDQRAALDAQAKSGEMALAFLGRWGQATDPSNKPLPLATGSSPAASSDALRQAAWKLLEEQAALKRRMADVDEATRQLQQAIQSAPKRGASWRTLRLDLHTDQAATLHVHYQVHDVRWSPSYRASLDSATGNVRLERQAEIVQGSGEDWSRVALTLSTGRVQRAPAGTLPGTWTLSLIDPRPVAAAAPMMERKEAARAKGIMTLAPPPAPAPVAEAEARDDSPVQSMDVDETAFATEFKAALPVDLPSDGQPHTLTLETRTLTAHVHWRAAPREAAAAWLVAEAPRPDGVWPAGPLQLWRDGRRVGTTTLGEAFGGDDDEQDGKPGATPRMTLPFGRDDRVRVAVTQPASMDAGTGLFNSRRQRKWGTEVTITNDHVSPIEVEVVDAAPVPTDERIQATTTFAPLATVKDWHHRQGVSAWTLRLAPGASQAITATHVVSWPAAMEVSALP